MELAGFIERARKSTIPSAQSQRPWLSSMPVKQLAGAAETELVLLLLYFRVGG